MRLARRVAAVTAGLLAAGLVTLLPALPAQAVQGTVPGSTAPMWQTNGIVRSLAVAGGVLYVGGEFTSVRPPGSAAGTGEVARNKLAAFNATTGALITTFNPNLNGNVRALSVNPAGTTLYAAGDFTSVGGTARSRVASFTTSSGALTSWAPTPDYVVSAISAGASTVYLGGGFTKVSGVTKPKIAAVDATTGAVRTAFSATADNTIYALAINAAADKLYVGGPFTSMNGNTAYHGAGVVNATTGALLPFGAGSVIPTPSASCSSVTRAIVVDANSVYFGNEGTGGGCFDGTFAANQSDGSLKWVSQCLGATQGIAVLNGNLYTGSHSHDCSGDQSFDPDAFGEVGWSKGLARHLLTRSTSTGAVGSWYPNTNGGTGQGLGPRTLATDGSQVFAGGEFTTVNGSAQQGIARFSPATSPVAVPATPAKPVAVARGGNKVSIFVQSPLDLDDTDLVVRLYRDGGSTPIASAPVHSLFWKQPVAAFEDSTQAGGTSHTYSIDVAQANGTGVSARATTSSVTVLATAPAYAAAVQADSPSLYWRLGESSGPVAADSSASLNGGTNRGTLTYGAAGAITGNTAYTFDGSTAYVTSEKKQSSPSTFSVEAWVKTTSTKGGKIIGFGDNRGGYDFSGNPQLSSSYDKQLYMTNDGRVAFGVYDGNTTTLTSSGTYNNGAWHLITGTQGPAGMVLYVDGVRQGKNGVSVNQGYDGYWRVGGDNLGSWPNQPTSNFFAGTIDDAAVYPAALSSTAVVAHYTASGRTAAVQTLPADSYGAAVVADAPNTFWRLDDTGATATDSSGNGNDGVVTQTVTPGVTGAIGFGKAATFDGVSGNVASGSPTTPGAYSTELFFKTSTSTGGKLIGFGNSQTGTSGNYDKQVYLTDDGRIEFGVYNNGFDLITTLPGYNDDAWHQVVAEQDASGMKLYVDNQLIGSNAVNSNQGYSGYWRAGGDNLGAWPDRPGTDWVSATIDEVAIYDAALPASAVSAHWTASGR